MPSETLNQTASHMMCLTRSVCENAVLGVESPSPGNTALVRHGCKRLSFVLIVLFASGILGSAAAVATELDDFLWRSRPLLVFAPTDGDARLVETVHRIEASRCDVLDRDMVIGVVVTEGTSTLDGQTIDSDEAQRLMNRYASGEDAFTVLLIGKDGTEKLRVNEVPDLRTIFATIDGMPMRGRETHSGQRRC